MRHRYKDFGTRNRVKVVRMGLLRNSDAEKALKEGKERALLTDHHKYPRPLSPPPGSSSGSSRPPLPIIPAGQDRFALLTSAGPSKVRGALTPRQRSNFISQTSNTMTYIEEFEVELTKKLDSPENTGSIVRWVSDKMLESYRNGIKAGQKGEVVKRSGQSRRPGFRPPQARQ